MPYISVTTANPLNQQQKDQIKTDLGQMITMIPNKTEKLLMVDISDNHTMYFAGEAMENCAYVDVRLYGIAPFACKSELTEAIFKMLQDVAHLQENQIYISYSEFNTWGTTGHLK